MNHKITASSERMRVGSVEPSRLASRARFATGIAITLGGVAVLVSDLTRLIPS